MNKEHEKFILKFLFVSRIFSIKIVSSYVISSLPLNYITNQILCYQRFLSFLIELVNQHRHDSLYGLFLSEALSVTLATSEEAGVAGSVDLCYCLPITTPLCTSSFLFACTSILLTHCRAVLNPTYLDFCKLIFNSRVFY
jgi:hypothetical protein